MEKCFRANRPLVCGVSSIYQRHLFFPKGHQWLQHFFEQAFGGESFEWFNIEIIFKRSTLIARQIRGELTAVVQVKLGACCARSSVKPLLLAQYSYFLIFVWCLFPKERSAVPFGSGRSALELSPKPGPGPKLPLFCSFGELVKHCPMFCCSRHFVLTLT